MAEIDPTTSWRNLRRWQLVPLALMTMLGDAAWGATRAPVPTTALPIEMAVAFGVVSIALLAIGLPWTRAKMFPARAPAGARPEQSIDGLETPAGRLAMRRLRNGFLVSWALCVAVATYGVTAAMMTHRFAWFAPFAAAGLIGLVASTPRASLLRAVSYAGKNAKY